MCGIVVNESRGRLLYIDVLRSSAIILVVVSHVFAPVVWNMNDYPPYVWWVFNVLDSAIRLCVPVFFMISGALLLGSSRDESFFRSVTRRYVKVVPSFFTWFMIYRLLHSVIDGQDLRPGAWLLNFLRGDNSDHLYFMYMILLLYLTVPFLRRLFGSATRGETGILVILWFGYLTIQFLFPDVYGNSGPSSTLIGYGGYFVLGCYLARDRDLTKRVWPPALLALATVAFNAVATYWFTIRAGGALDEKFYWGQAPLVALYAGCFFLAVKNLNWDGVLAGNPWLRGPILFLSLESYNLYLVHVLFVLLFSNGCLGFVLSQDTCGNALIGVPLTFVAVIAASLGFVWLLRRTPLVSRILIIQGG
jgi:surface polysaccharide O-acyltransferase-like enzyme